jgi:predicted transcriptional regulator of viral defense system
MRYLELKEHFKEFVLFSLKDIKKIDPNFHRRRIGEWKEKGYIKNIINAYYIFADKELEEQSLYFIANKVYNPSYVSLEAALSYYGFIPEAVFAVTSMSTRKTKTFSTIYGDMIYKHIHPRYFFGYDLVEFKGFRYKIASPEKAVLDFLYLNPGIKSKGDMEELRMNSEEVHRQIDRDRFDEFLKGFGKQALRERAKLLMEVIDSDRS